MIKTEGKVYTEIEDYAKIKGVTIQTVYNWIKNGTVKTRKILKTTYVQL